MSSWQTEGLPPAILTPSVASRLAEGGGRRRGPPEGRSCGTRATADASGDARANAASELPRSRGLRCGATRARGASRGRRPDRPSSASAPRVLERRTASSCGWRERGPEEDGPLRNLGLRTTTTTTAERKKSNITQGLNSA
ncbi:hypothetical protein NDU88_002911 [Pleurodeles waltl]|uniref:Uncharacterized protein n=1 Tax=Pleurodeles waltl TaxID=8319 RepID=A0AAV7UED9_PLEWA|nr:hypothetical protein NDU88_002911 [Pleurodeles waltl]